MPEEEQGKINPEEFKEQSAIGAVAKIAGVVNEVMNHSPAHKTYSETSKNFSALFSKQGKDPLIFVGVVAEGIQGMEGSSEGIFSASELMPDEIPPFFDLNNPDVATAIIQISLWHPETSPLGKGLLEYGGSLPEYFIGSDDVVYGVNANTYIFDNRGYAARVEKIRAVKNDEFEDNTMPQDEIDALPHVDIAFDDPDHIPLRFFPVREGDIELVIGQCNALNNSLKRTAQQPEQLSDQDHQPEFTLMQRLTAADYDDI